jgi:hypothetical protein
MRSAIAIIAVTVTLIVSQTSGTPTAATPRSQALIDTTAITMALSDLPLVTADAF